MLAAVKTGMTGLPNHFPELVVFTPSFVFDA
jgi:hypothetical protein